MSTISNFPKMSAVAALLFVLAGAVTAAERYKIANEGAIGDDWALASGAVLAVPGYPAAFAGRADDVCIALGYAINPDGSTSNFSTLKMWSSSAAVSEVEPVPGYWDAFIQAAANGVSQWKFVPRTERVSPRTTYTVATLYFTGKPKGDTNSLRNRCAISDLTDFLQERKAEAFLASREKALMENRGFQRQGWRIEQLAAELEQRAKFH